MSSDDLAEFRARFPIFKRRVYVNSCSQGALSTDVDEAMRAYLDSWHESGSPWEMWVEQVERLRVRFAASIGADVDEIAVMPSASAGINAVASALTLRRPALARRHRRLRVSDDGAGVAGAGAPRRDDPPGACVADVAGHAAARRLRRRDRRTHADRAGDARLLPERPQDRHRRSGAAGARSRRLRLPRRLSAHRLRSDRRARARRGLHGHRMPEVPARGGRDRISLRADGISSSSSSRPSPAGSAASTRSRSGSTRSTGRRAPIDSRAGRRRCRTPTRRSRRLELLDRIGYEVVGRQVDHLVEPLRVRRARPRASSCEHRPRRSAAVRSSSSRAWTAPALVSKLAARGIIASCRGNGLRVAFHAYNTDADVDAVLDALAAESALLEHATFAQ